MDPFAIATLLFDDPSRSFAVELWDGTLLPPRRGTEIRGRVVIRRPEVIEALFPPASERRLAEAFISGALELEGDAIGLLEAASEWRGPRLDLAMVQPALSVWLRRALPGSRGGLSAELRGRSHTPGRDQAAVRHHYDLSDELYQLFLDPEMVYSCAYFQTGAESLEEAQRAKLELVCSKLDLGPEDRLLDLGCGWGALVVHAADRHRAQGLGVTLSENQLNEARRRLRNLREPRMEVRACDYRQLEGMGPFDKVSSIGMMEHVGREQLDTYFSAVHRHLRPGGLFLNHAIASVPSTPRTLPWALRREGGFIERFIFPDSDLIPVGDVVKAAERAGFEVRDLESLREHYAQTLALWLARLEGRFDEAVALVGRDRARAFRLYLAASAVGFRTGKLSIFQLLLVKPNPDGRVQGIPRCRANWYKPSLSVAPTPEMEANGRAASAH